MVGFFYIFSGGAIPILRASLMALSFSVSLWYSRPTQGFYSLCWSLALILNFFPWSLLDPSFQLSFVATAGLLALTTFFTSKNFLGLLVVTPLVAFIVTAPLILYHFYRISLISLVSNLLGVPYVTFLLLPLSFGITAAFFICPMVALWLMVLFEPLARFFVWGVHLFSSFPWSSFYLSSPTPLEIFIYYGFLIFISYSLFCRRYDRVLKGFVLGMSVLSLSFGLSIYLKHKDLRLKVSFLSVGQGDSSLIELPHGKTVLVDGGGLWGSFDIGERVVGPYLLRKRIRRLDAIILSHSDFDHSGGLAFILKHFNVGQIWLSQWQAPTKTFYETLALAEKYQVPCYLLSAEHASLYVGGTRFQFLNPQNSFLNEGAATQRTNNLSLVFKMTHKNFSVLFTGDIEKEIEEELLLKDIHATILKVPHHGSKTSSSYPFLKKVSPSLAVMSLGVQNRYHFPHGAVLKRYEALKIPIWRTDEKGTLQIQTDGFDYQCLTPRLCLFN
ncbi:MAG: DNA internalization-related competence protein ComEC/Rec2 [Deltaproteobacteria bacterium]|nr:DNA internalization-related competence protein ComEC/Rec2 [Deltaproteobacteria bacterium]